MIKTPLLSRFVALTRAQPDLWSAQVVKQLQTLVGDEVPEFWSVSINPLQCPGLIDVIKSSERSITLRDLYRDIGSRNQQAIVVAILIERDGILFDMPPADFDVRVGDHILFAGTLGARSDLMHILLNINVARSVILGENVLSGYLFRTQAAGRADLGSRSGQG